jgi:peptide/nickel transport system permease protein
VSIGSFLLRRLGSGLLAILGVSVLVFAFLHLVPGDPVDQLAGGDATPEQRAKIEQCMGLDKPLVSQFGTFLGHVVDGTLGHQCKSGDPRGPTVASRIAEVLPHTIALALCGMIIAIVLALPLGVLAAVRRGTWIDTTTTIASLSVIGLPIMLLGPVLLLVFFVWLGWVPGPTETGPLAIAMPAFALGLQMMAMLSRMTRSSMIEVLGEDYVRTARSKGLPERTVVLKHALRNALVPIVTVLGLTVALMIGGAVVTETVFGLPGVGNLVVSAVLRRDYPVIQGALLVIAAIYVLINFGIDLLYAVVDPRVKF